MKNLLTRLWKEEEGQDLAEYALALVLIAVAAIATASTLGNTIAKVFTNVNANLTT